MGNRLVVVVTVKHEGVEEENGGGGEWGCCGRGAVTGCSNWVQ